MPRYSGTIGLIAVKRERYKCARVLDAYQEHVLAQEVAVIPAQMIHS